MAYRNKFDTNGESFDLGSNAEKAFVNAAKKASIKIKEASKEEEFRHIDFHIQTEKGNSFSVEVKSRKKIKRSDAAVSDEYVWVEFKNVQGKRGWLYGGADLVAFEREHDFLIVNRKLLARLCEKLCDLTQINKDPWFPLYTGKQRKDRDDLLSLIRMKDIETNIKFSLLKK